MKAPSVIIGGGPVGGFLATQLTSSLLVDQKARIGTPVRCTGILTNDIETLVPKKLLTKATRNKIHSTKIVGPTQEVTLNIGTNYIICNETFDSQLVDLAQDKGARIHLATKYLRSERSKHYFKDLKTKKQFSVESPQLVGCDGPQSVVNTQFGIRPKNKSYLGRQVSLKVKEHENHIQFFPHIGAYAWYVPESPTSARVGICARENPKPLLDAFLKRFRGKQTGLQAGFIPYHQPYESTTKRVPGLSVSLLGDAGLHIKNTTGGGIIPGIKSATQFAQNPSLYRRTPLTVRRELYSHFLVHNILKQCSHKEWDTIITAVKQNTSGLEQINRDQLWKLLPRLLTNTSLVGIGVKKMLGGLVSRQRNILF